MLRYKVQGSSKDVATLNLLEDCNCAIGICMVSFVVSIISVSAFCCLVAWTSLSGMPISTTWLGWFLCLRSHFWYHSSFSCGWCWCSWNFFDHVGETIPGFGLWIPIFCVFIAELAFRDETYFNQARSSRMCSIWPSGRAKQNDKFTNIHKLLNPTMKMNGSVKSPQLLVCLQLHQLHQLQLGDWLPDSKQKGFPNALRLI